DLSRAFLFAELVARAARDHVAAVIEEALQRLLQIERLRAPGDDGEVDHAERRLQIRHSIELVDDDLRKDVLLQLDDEADAVAIGLVADLADAFDLLVANELADVRGDARLVDLIRDLREDDLLAIGAVRDRLDHLPRAHDDRAATRALRLLDAAAPIDE